MRLLNSYDMIYCDIDKTLIHGWFVDFMDKCWDIFHSKTLAKVLMTIEATLQLYKLNEVLYFMLLITDTPITFITARCHCKATIKLIYDMFKFSNKDKHIRVVEMATSTPDVDKLRFIAEELEKYPNCCLFEDNKKTIELVRTLDIDVFDAAALYELRVK